MTDIFSEIEQDLRREQVNKLWEKYGIYLISLAVGIVVVAAMIVGWRAWVTSRAEASSAEYDALMAVAATQKPEEAAAALGAFAENATRGYAVLARMQQAGELVKAGDEKGAVAALDKIADDSGVSPILRGMAQVKAGLLLVDTSSYDEMNARLASLDESGNIWRNNARELLGLSAYKAKKYAEAEANFSAIIADEKSSPGLRDRAHVMQALLAPHLPTPAVADTTTDKSKEEKAAEPAPTNGADAKAAPDTKSE
ncbi:MAG: tetratricopeptide repeat protein [Parvibaculum sp.]